MGSVRQRRRRLPKRVYWVRRGMVLLLALLLVLGIGKLLGGTGSDGSAIRASTSASTPSVGSSVAIGPVAPTGKLRTKASPALLPPSGACVEDEVSVLPSVPVAYAGQPVSILLQLQGTQPACTFELSPKSLVVKVVSLKERIWSSQDCPAEIPTTTVVVRSGAPVVVPMIWSGRRSDTQCADKLAWALPGFYHVYAAALGSTPSDVQFEITRAPTLVVTRTPKPSPNPSASPRAVQQSAPTAPRPRVAPSGSPSGRPSAQATANP